MTDAAASLAAALAQLQARLPRVGKAETAQVRSDKGSYSYSYASLHDVSSALFPVMAELVLSFTAAPTLMSIGGETKFVLHYQLMFAPLPDEEPERIDGMYPLGTGNPQQLGSAITYARRYCLLAVTGLAPDDGSDDDAQAAEQSYRAMRNAPPETRADGSATEAEIMRMQAGPEPGLERRKGRDPDDAWHDQPAGQFDGPPEEAPGSVHGGQMRAIHMLFKRRGIEGDEAVRAECCRILGREVTSRAQLSHVDAAAIIAWKEPASDHA
jgi:hypothetical protein